MDRTRIARIGGLDIEGARSRTMEDRTRFARNARQPHPIPQFASRFKSRTLVDPSPRQPAGRQVTFEFIDAEAASVSVAGTFSTGRPQIVPLRNVGGGEWCVQILVEPGRYEYHFLVDGQCRPDPTAAQQVTNLCGGVNSLLVVE
jgi:hypothetical protein